MKVILKPVYARPTSVHIYLDNEAKALINSDEITIKIYDNYIIIRRPNIDSKRVLSIKNNFTTFSRIDPDGLIGEYDIEQDGDDFILTKIKGNGLQY